jgi:hypothetical protein
MTPTGCVFAPSIHPRVLFQFESGLHLEVVLALALLPGSGI